MFEFSKNEPEEQKVIVLDNGVSYKAKKLKIPENIILIVLPPYSTELNPVEKIRAKFKRDFTNRIFYNTGNLVNYFCQLSINLFKKEVISISKFRCVFYLIY